MAEKILHDYPGDVDVLSLHPSSGGVFEVSVDGRLAFSRKATGTFPEPDSFVKEIEATLKG